MRRAALLAVGLPLVGAAAACGRRGAIPAGTSSVATLGQPLPVDAGLLLASDLPIEHGATLRVLEWKDYLSADVLRAFERAHAADDITSRSKASRTSTRRSRGCRTPRATSTWCSR